MTVRTRFLVALAAAALLLVAVSYVGLAHVLASGS